MFYFCLNRTSVEVLKLLLKYGCTLLLLLGYSHLFAFTNASTGPTISEAETISTCDYHREVPQTVKLEIVYIEERLETDDDEFFTLIDQGIDQLQSHTFAFQEHLLHHAGNREFSAFTCQSPAAIRSPYLVLRVFRL